MIKRSSMDGIAQVFVGVILLVGAPHAYAQSVSPPPLSGQHSWSHLGSDSARSSRLAASGPETPILEPPEWPYGPVNGNIAASPVADAFGNVYFGSDSGKFLALRPSATTTSRLRRWSFTASGPIRSAAAIKPTSPEFPQKRIYFTTESGHLYSLDSNGKLIWQHNLRGVSVAPVSSPTLTTVPGGPGPGRMRLYLATSDGIYALEERRSSSGLNVVLLWHEPRVRSAQSVAISPDGNRVYATGERSFYALDVNPRGGSQILAQTGLGSRLTGPVVDRSDRAYVGSEAGDVYQIDAPNARVMNRNTFSGSIRTEPALMPGVALGRGGQLAFISGGVLHSAPRNLQSSSWSFDPSAQSPAWETGSRLAVDGSGTIFLADTNRNTRIHAIRNGNEAWRYPLGGASVRQPALTRDGRLYTGTQAGRMHALQPDPAFTIAFSSDRQGTPVDIYKLRSAYGAVGATRRLTSTSSVDTQPAYSSLGEWLAFTADTPQRGKDIYIGTAAGQSLVNLNRSTTQNPFNFEIEKKDPAFSPTDRLGRSLLPDGKRYLAVTAGNRSSWSAYFVDLDAFVNRGRLTGVDLHAFLQRQSAAQVASRIPPQQAQVAFSPDGRLMAYGGCRPTGSSGAEYQLRVVNMGQSSESVVTRTSSDDCAKSAHYHPFFSPDGAHLVYEKEGALYRTSDMAQPGSAITGSATPDVRNSYDPSWSPDGTEIVFERFSLTRSTPSIHFNTPPSVHLNTPPVLTATRTLRILYGSGYGSEKLISRDVSGDGVYHPRRLPDPETRIARCNANQTLQPASQQPGKTIEIRGCGFDIRFPKNNTIVFPRADGNGVIRMAARDTRVDPSSGLGVLEVEVPLLAGDGQLVVDTPFGPSETIQSDFHVRPLATTLRKAETVPDAFVRVLGYGFETGDPGSYRVRFAGGTTVTPAALRLRQCQTPGTPCRLSRAAGGEIGWLEVQVPGNVAPGRVIVERTVAGATHTDSPGQRLSLRTPSISLSRNTGSEGAPAENIDPVAFKMQGGGFPYDRYFGYTQVDLSQADPAGTNRALGTEPLSQSGGFSKQTLEVQPNSGGDLTMAAQLPATRGSGPLARATAPFSTPLKNPPIVFVPGTSGTYLKYDVPASAGPVYGRVCGTTAIASLAPIASALGGAPAAITFASIGASAASWPHFKSDYWPRENIWLQLHGIVHILAGCANWLDAIHLNPDNNQPPSKYSDVQPGEVIRKIKLPGDDKIVYSKLFDFMRNSMNREIVKYGDSCSGNRRCTYLFNADWRMGMDRQSRRLDRLVDKALRETGASGVAIVTHSYGGPTAKYYLRSRANAPSKVDQVITLGGGHMGVVKPYKILEHGAVWGVKFGPFKLKDQKPQQMARDWPTAYWQLPQSNWSLDGNAGHSNVNSICPPLGRNGVRNCGWIKAEWDATKSKFGPSNFSPGPGLLGNGSKPYSFVEDATAFHPFRGRPGLGPPLKKFYPNINNDSGATKYPLGAVYQPGVNFSDKFGTARKELLDVQGPQNNSTLSCARFSDTGLGDWRCGTQGVFFHRIVGWGKRTEIRVRFKHDWKCVVDATILGRRISVCFNKRNIYAKKTREGDQVIPLRSAVGILENDAAFDSRDSRIWGVDGNGKTEYGSNLHMALAHMSGVHEFIELAAGGKLTDITQVPSNATWPSGKWPFKVPCGVPHPPASVPQERGCGPQSMRTTSLTLSDDQAYWNVELESNAELFVRNAEDDRVAGPVPELPGVASTSVPGVDYERDAGRTVVSVPAGSGTYEFHIARPEQLDGAERAPELARLRIAPESPYSEGPVHIFHAVPLTAQSEAEFTWDTADPAEEPVLRLDYTGEGEVTELTPDATLTGAAVGDEQAPSTEVRIDGNTLTIEAQDEGGSGIHRVFWGTRRGKTNPRIYDGPVELPENTSYVWAIAVDRAGNTALEPATYESCRLPMDFDGNGAVEQNDLDAVAGRWLSHRFAGFDLNGLGPVDVGDIQRTVATLEKACPIRLDAAPYPARREEARSVVDLRTSGAVQSGDTFTVDVVLEDPDNVAGLEAVVSYAPGLLRFEDISLNERLATNESVAGLLGPHIGPISASLGQAVAFGAYSISGEEGLSDEAVPVRLTFTATEPGTAELQVFEAQVSDPSGTLAQSRRGSTEIEVVER